MIPVLVFVVILNLLLTVLLFLSRREARALGRQLDRTRALLGAKLDFARKRLEIISDMGPTGPDPLPPCIFCGEGPGHWTKPTHDDCPAVLAWRAVQRLNSGEDLETS